MANKYMQEGDKIKWGYKTFIVSNIRQMRGGRYEVKLTYDGSDKMATGKLRSLEYGANGNPCTFIGRTSKAKVDKLRSARYEFEEKIALNKMKRDDRRREAMETNESLKNLRPGCQILIRGTGGWNGGNWSAEVASYDKYKGIVKIYRRQAVQQAPNELDKIFNGLLGKRTRGPRQFRSIPATCIIKVLD
jgi:hypothetical protein